MAIVTTILILNTWSKWFLEIADWDKIIKIKIHKNFSNRFVTVLSVNCYEKDIIDYWRKKIKFICEQPNTDVI